MGLYNRIKVRRYLIESNKLEAPIRIALISDFHSCYYGDNCEELVDAITKEKPDIIVLTGDIFDDELDDTNVIRLFDEIADSYPCFYVTGNHEYKAGAKRFSEQMNILEEYGIRRLEEESYELDINDQHIRLCGIGDPAGAKFYDMTKAEFINYSVKEVAPEEDDPYYNILLAHRPDYFDTYSKYPFDLVLCGHTHGGVVRIPLLMNGWFAYGQGYFPKYSGGFYQQYGTDLIISRGLSRESSGRRYYNRPELVIIDID